MSRNLQKYALDEGSQEKFLSAAEEMGWPHHHVVRILLATGMHSKPLCELSRANIQQDGQLLVWQRTKTSKSCFARLDDPKLREVVEEWVSRKHPKSNSMVNYLVHEVGERVGMEEVSPLSFRHTYAYNRLKLGENPALVAKRMQCSQELIWQAYARLPDSLLFATEDGSRND